MKNESTQTKKSWPYGEDNKQSSIYNLYFYFTFTAYTNVLRGCQQISFITDFVH